MCKILLQNTRKFGAELDILDRYESIDMSLICLVTDLVSHFLMLCRYCIFNFKICSAQNSNTLRYRFFFIIIIIAVSHSCSNQTIFCKMLLDIVKAAKTPSLVTGIVQMKVMKDLHLPPLRKCTIIGNSFEVSSLNAPIFMKFCHYGKFAANFLLAF